MEEARRHFSQSVTHLSSPDACIDRSRSRQRIGRREVFNCRPIIIIVAAAEEATATRNKGITTTAGILIGIRTSFLVSHMYNAMIVIQWQ